MRIFNALLFAIVYFSYSQSNLDFNSFKGESYSYSKRLESHLISDLYFEGLKTSNKEGLAIVDETKKNVKKNLETKHKNDYFLFNTPINDLLDKIFNEITSKNKHLIDQKMLLTVSKSTIPNAYCYPNGVFQINIGIMPHFENESQLAFVICHEIAHHQLKHLSQELEKRINYVTSLEYKQNVKKLESTEYGRNIKALELLKANAISESSHSRINEKQADSLGMVFLRNTLFDEQEAVKAMLILDEIDDYYESKTFNLEKIFSSQEKPFDKEWLDDDAAGFKLYQKRTENELKLLDSLKTHPDCKIRAESLKKLAQTKKFTNKIIDKIEYEKVIWLCNMESLQRLYDTDEISSCLYRSFYLRNKFPKSSFVALIQAQCLNRLFLGRKNHKYSHLVEKPNKINPTPYNEFLIFLNNLSMREIAEINFFKIKQETEFHNTDELIYEMWLAGKHLNDSTKMNDAKNILKKNNPKSKFLTLIEQ